MQLLNTNWYSLFYWLTRAEDFKAFLDSSSNWFTFFAIVAGIIYVCATINKVITTAKQKVENNLEEVLNTETYQAENLRKYSTRLFYTFLFLSIVTWLAWAAVPTKKDCLLIVAGGGAATFLTGDSSARSLPADMTKYLHLSMQEQIKNLSTDAKEAIGVATPKETFLEKAKQMTKEEIIAQLETDSTVLKK